jgi:hypothetical protein
MSCGKLANGLMCPGGSATCASGFCVDGYCCDSACNTAPCQACDVTGKQGMCSTVPGPINPPHGSRSCTHQGTICGGYCNGATTACAYPSATNCFTTCSSMSQLRKDYCDGAGNCAVGTPMTCANGFACEGVTCVTSCGTASDCAPGYACVPGGVCMKICVFDQDDWNQCVVR